MWLKTIISLFIIHSLGPSLIHGACIPFPTQLQSGTWISSDMGDVTFNATHFSVTNLGGRFGAVTFECITSGTWIKYYSVSSAFQYLGNSLKASICFNLQQQSDTKWVYMLMTDTLANTDTTRIYLNADSHSFTWSDVCTRTADSYAQQRLLIKEDSVNVSTSTCGNNIAGLYEYYNVTGMSCSDTRMDVCTDTTGVTFNYTRCATKMAYSANGVLACVHSSTVGTQLQQTLYNMDTTTDESTYYRYTCLIAEVHNGVTYVSMFPRGCLDSQNVTTIASPGMTFEMTANETCATPATAAQTSSTLSAGGAAAVVLALLVIFAAVGVIGVWYYIKVYRVKKIDPQSADLIPSKSPPIDTMDGSKKMDGRVSPFSSFPTVSELALYRFGPEIDDDDGGMTLGATTPGFTDGRRTNYDKEADKESQVSIPMYSEVGGETPDPTRLSEVQTSMSEISESNVAQPFTMTRATMNIPEETTVSPMQSPRENGDNKEDVTL